MASQLKKGGQSRYVLTDMTVGSSFSIPGGFYIDKILVVSTDLVSTGSIAIGTAPAVLETATFTVTGAPTSDGDITIAGETIAILDADTVSGVATKIASHTFTSWTATSDGAVVTMTATGAGNKSNVTASAGSTGATFGSVTTVAGTQPNQVVADTALPSEGVANVTALSLSTYIFPATDILYVNSTNESVFTLHVLVQKYN